VEDSVPRNLHPNYMKDMLRWQRQVIEHIDGNISYVQDTIEHSWHGPKAKRYYADRWQILAANQFDPCEDLKKNTYGVMELAGNKPMLRRDMDLYFRARDEDSNSMD
jgi:hypothetical protein